MEATRTLVVDANAIIDGWMGWKKIQDRLVSVSEVVEELRDPNARSKACHVDVLEPSAAAMRRVEACARRTGDLRSLSKADWKLLALTWDLCSSRIPSFGRRTETKGRKDRDPRWEKKKRMSLPGWDDQDPEEWLEEEQEDLLEMGKHVPGSASAQEIVTQRSFSSKEGEGTSSRDGTESQIHERKNKEDEDLSEDDGVWERRLAPSRRRHKQRKEWERVEEERMAREQAERELRAMSILKLKEQETPEGTPDNEPQDDGKPDEMAAIHISGVHSNLQEGHTSEGGDFDLEDDEEPSVACVTADFPMQNVLLHLGLPLLAPNGKRIRELHIRGLRCSACYYTTREVERIFCPQCGNKDTLEQVPVVVGNKGEVEFGHVTRHKLRGTRYSLPKPKGGRHADQPILREDVLLSRLPKSKYKGSDPTDVFSCEYGPDTWLSDRAPKHAKGILASLDTSRRNPNERRLVRKNK